MHRLETEPLLGFNETAIDPPARFEVLLPDGRQIRLDALLGATPVVTTSFDGKNDPQLVLHQVPELDAWDDMSDYPVGRMSGIHGRNLEVLADRVVIEDEFGNEFNSLCIKGSVMDDPHLFKHPVAAREYSIYGFQESLVMERVLRASKLLRENDIAAEYIIGLALPEKFPYPSNQNVGESVLLTLPELLGQMATRYAREQKDKLEVTALEFTADLIERFKDCDYLISYRAMDTPFRYGELSDPEVYEKFKAFVSNLDSECPLAEFLRDEPQEIFLSTLVPYHLAKNVAKMHKLGLIHGFLHSNNVTALGALVDLDSCRGEALGLDDKPVTEEEIFDDIDTVLTSINAVMDEVPFENMPANMCHVKRMDASVMGCSFFLEKYAEERFDDPADRVKFLASFLAYSAHERATDSPNSMYLLTTYVTQYFHDKRSKLPQDPTELALPNMPLSSVKRSDTWLRFIPPAFFAENAENILSESFEIQDKTKSQLEELEPGKASRQIHAFIGGMRNVFLGNLTRNFSSDLSLDESLSMLRVMTRLSHSKAQLARRRKSGETETDLRIAAYVDANMESTIASFSQPDISSLSRELVDKLGSKIPDLAENTAGFTFHGNKVVSPIVYRNSVEEYCDILEALGVDPDSQAQIMDPYLAERIRDGKIVFDEQTLVLSDYEHLGELLEFTDSLHLTYQFFAVKRKLPPVFIWHAGEGEPFVRVWPNRDSRNAALTYRELFTICKETNPKDAPTLHAML